MSTITIQLLKAVDISKPNAAKNYQQMVVTHTDLATGKTDGKKIFDFTTPKEVWETLKNAQPLQTFEVDRQKDAKEGKYWEWKAVRAVTVDKVPTNTGSTPVASPVPAGSSATSAPSRVGNWETPEERSKKQVYIIRQSSVSNAIEFHKNAEEFVSLDTVLATARAIENYVLGKGVADMTDDFPE